MIEQDRFEQAVTSLYAAAVGEVAWVSAATLVTDAIRAHGHSLTYADLGAGVEPEIRMARFFVGAKRRDDLEQLYFRDYYPRDEAIPRLLGLQQGDLIHKSDLYTDREKKTSATYNEFRRLNKTQHGLFIGLEGPDACAVVWSLGNSLERDGWGQDQIRAIRRLAPHMRRFACIRESMIRSAALGASLTQLLENRRSGFIQVNRRGLILEANDRARDILLKGDGLREAGGMLAARIPSEDAELQRLLGEALPSYGTDGVGGSMKVTRLKARTPLVIETHPLRGSVTDYPARGVAALVLVLDPSARPRIDSELPSAVLGLSPMESRVAVAAVNGQTVPGIAHELGCAESTVRTHLKRIYRKLAIRSRTGLMRLLLSLEGLRGPVR